MYYVAFPRSFRIVSEQHGVWDIAKDDNGIISFNNVEEAKQYGKDNAHKHIGEFYVLDLVG